ncbi:MAG: hypothetical protein HYW78_03085 [Parcubacteria group bacterium]|nr:hypothetical protein [Parcubacteria group bacterium]
MMEIFPLIILIGSAVALIAIVIKKIFDITHEDIERFEEDHAVTIKKVLAEAQLKRAAGHAVDSVRNKFSFIGLFFAFQTKKIESFFQRSIARLQEKEKHYLLKDDNGREELFKKLYEEGEVFLAGKNYVSAEKSFLEALKIYPKKIDLYKKLFIVYNGMRKFFEARECLLVVLRVARKQVDRPEAYHLTANEARQEFSSLLFTLSQFYNDFGKPQRALYFAKQLLASDSRNPKYLDFIIDLYILTKNKKAAYETIQIMQEINPENAKLTAWSDAVKKMR